MFLLPALPVKFFLSRAFSALYVPHREHRRLWLCLVLDVTYTHLSFLSAFFSGVLFAGVAYRRFPLLPRYLLSFLSYFPTSREIEILHNKAKSNEAASLFVVG